MSELKQLKIEEYSLVDFVMKIQQGIRDGYEVNDSSDDAPLQIGGSFHLIMREAAKPSITVGKLVMDASIDTTKLQEQLKAGGEIEQALSDNLIIGEVDYTKDADKWDNKELGADEAYVETIEPPKEPTMDESLPKEEQALLQTKPTTKRGRK
jgi:hypothetical protein